MTTRTPLRPSRRRYLDDRQIGEAKHELSHLWNRCEELCRKHGCAMPPIVFVPDNADAFEHAAHVELGKKLFLICRSRLSDSDDPSKGFAVELVVSEKVGSLVGVSKLAVTYETAAGRWLFFCGTGKDRSVKIARLLERLGINPLARVTKDVNEVLADGLVRIIVSWAVECMPARTK